MLWISVLICVLPFQFLAFYIAYFCMKKFDKYEKIGMLLINQHLDSRKENIDVEEMYADYQKIMGELSPRDSEKFKCAHSLTSVTDVRTEYQKLAAFMKTKHRQFLLESSIIAIANTLHSRRDDSSGLITWVQSNMSKKIVDDIDRSPLASILLDLVSAAWVHSK